MTRLSRALIRALLLTTLAALLISALFVGASWWALRSDRGTLQLMSWLPGLEVTQAKGSIWGDFQAERLTYTWPNGSTLVVVAPRWQGLSVVRTDQAAWRLGLSIRSLQAQSADLQWRASATSGPLKVPASLALPVAVRIDALSVARFQSNLTGDAPWTGLKASLSLQSGATHELVLMHLARQDWTVQGRTRVGVSQPMTLSGNWTATSRQGQGVMNISGPLAQPRVQGRVQIQPVVASKSPVAQSLQVDLTLQPFARWPVSHGLVQAQDFDFQRLNPAWPSTMITGQVDMLPRAALPGAPGERLTAPKALDAVLPKATPPRMLSDLMVLVDVRNERPGPWDQARLPLVSAKGRLTLPAQSDASDIAQVGRSGLVDLGLGLLSLGGRAPGTVTLSGQWDLDQRAQTRILARMDRVDLVALDGRAPPLLLQGQTQVQGQPDQSWKIEANLVGKDAPAGKAFLAGQSATAKALAQWWPGRLVVESLSLQAGAAKAQGQGQWRQVGTDGSGGWQGDAALSLKAFDPAVWMPWPRPAGDELRRTRLDGQFKLAAQRTGTDPHWWAGLKGTAQGQLDGSVLLGVPVQARLEAKTGERWQAAVQWQTGVNRVQADVSWPQAAWQALAPADGAKPGGVPAGVTAQVKADVADLSVWRSWGQAMGIDDLAGRVRADAQWLGGSVGQWRTQGSAEADGVKLTLNEKSLLSLQGVSGRWSISQGQGDAAPWQADLQVAQARWGSWGVQQAQARLSGQPANHQMFVHGRVDLPERTLSSGAKVNEAVQAHWEAQGRWQGRESQRDWQVDVKDLHVTPMTVAPSAPWLSVDPFQWRWQSGDGRPQWTMTPTRARVFGAVLALEQGQWRQGSDGSQTDVRMSLQPLKVSELLARWQPRAGWGGDLTVVGQFMARQDAQGKWRVEAGIDRQAGDLTLRDTEIEGGSVQRLGVRQIKLGLLGVDGVWTATQLLDGRVLGILTGEQRVVSQGASVLPGASDALTGSLSFKADNLRAASVWAPAGWRLSGQLGSQLQIQGTLGVPVLEGRVTGQNLGVTNPLLGVQVTSGELSLLLKDRTAVIERFVARGGDLGGRIALSGQAQFGTEPTAQLILSAEKFAVLQRVDRRAVVSGNLELGLTADTLKADGRIQVDEGLVDITRGEAPTVGDDVNVVNRPGQADDEMPATPAVRRKLQATITLDLGQQLRLRGSGLDTLLSGALRLSTPNGRPQLQGVIQASDGTYKAYGQKLIIERGSLAFTGPVDNPRLDIQAMRPQSATASSSDVQVGVLISGTAQDPRVRLYSEPPMSETEKLSWLVLGRGPMGLGSADIGLLQTAASALLDGEGPSTKDTVISTLGLDDLSVRQTDGAVRDTIVSVGKQVSARWYLGYERSLNATTGTWQAIYRLAQRFTLRAQAGDDNAVDIIWSWRWD